MKLSDLVVYDDWEFETRAELRRRAVLPIVLGNEPRPLGSSGSKAVKAWVVRRDVATATIIGRLDPSQFVHIREFEEDPAGMWASLKETHLGSMGGVVAVWKKLHGLRKSGDPGTMCSHIATVRGLAEKLGRLYNDKPSDAQIIATLLMSLPPSYDTLIISLDSHAEKDDLEFVIGRLLNEETRQENALSLPGINDPQPVAFAARMIWDKSRITCWKCQKLGHFQSECSEPGPLAPVPPHDVVANAAHTTEYYF
jgi:hypothetical protein